MPSDPRDYKLEISGLNEPIDDGRRAAGPAGPRSFLSVRFACCGAYQRVYRSPDGRHYEGRCPRCARPVRFVVGEGGTSARCFIVS